MYRFLPLVCISSLVAASIIQQPLAESDSGTPRIPITSSKQLVSSRALEAHITKENLLERAKHLYKIAELGAEEYNHPTRVIGSKGKLHPLLTHTSALLLTVISHRTHCYNQLHLLDNSRPRRLLRNQQSDFQCGGWKCLRISFGYWR
jgi:hypothetical protein